MFYTLLFLVSCELLSLSISPGIHGTFEEFDEGEHKVTWKAMDFRKRNIQFGAHAPRQASIMENAPKTTSTKTYWNLTRNRCDYQRFRCQLYSMTGAVCARTIFYQYFSFGSYCSMEFHNCVIKSDNAWRIAYMGLCNEIVIDPALYAFMTYEQMTNHTKLTEMYVNADDETDFAGFASTVSTESTIETTTAEVVFDMSQFCKYKNTTLENGTIISEIDSCTFDITTTTSSTEAPDTNDTATNNTDTNVTNTNNTVTNSTTEKSKILRFNWRRLRKVKGRRGWNAASVLNLRTTINKN